MYYWKIIIPNTEQPKKEELQELKDYLNNNQWIFYEVKE